MGKLLVWLGIIFSCLTTIACQAQQSITVLVPNFPPYTQIKAGEITGIGIEKANLIFQRANIKVTYRILPNYAKVLHELKLGRGDAFLLASQNDERDLLAVFSKPILINRWCWYQLKSATITPSEVDFKSNATVSSHFNTNTHKWLINNNYRVEPVTDISTLPDILLRERVNAVFLAELVFEKAIAQKGIALSRFNKQIEIEKPFGIYFSKPYLARYTKTLDNVNQAISDLNF